MANLTTRAFDFSEVYMGVVVDAVRQTTTTTSVSYFLDHAPPEGQSSTLVFRGSGIAFSGDRPTSGVITSWTEIYKPDADTAAYTATTFTGISVSLVKLYEVANTASTADDRALVRQMLDGNDVVRLAGRADYFNGFSGNDRIYGGGGNDRLGGNSGNDLIVGGAGSDILSGGVGRDTFLFNTTPGSGNVDRITDFNPADDQIQIDNAIMAQVGPNGTLAAGLFWKSASGLAHDANDRIIYETDTGKLFYDSNGNAAGGAVQIATLSANLALTHADFVVV